MHGKPMSVWGMYWAINVFTIIIFSLLVPTAIVLGNALVPAFLGAVIAGILLVAIEVHAIPMANRVGIKSTDDVQTVFIELLANALGIWLITRVASITGFGIASFVWVIVLAISITVIQWVAVKGIGNKKGKKK